MDGFLIADEPSFDLHTDAAMQPLANHHLCAPPQVSGYAHNPDGLSYASADSSEAAETVEEAQLRRQSKRGSRFATASVEARSRKEPTFRSTDDWEFKSMHRNSEQEVVRRRASKAPTPVLTDDVPLISLDDEYHQAMDMDEPLPRGEDRRASESRSRADKHHSSTSIDDEMEEDANQRGWFSPKNPRSRDPDATQNTPPPGPAHTHPPVQFPQPPSTPTTPTPTIVQPTPTPAPLPAAPAPVAPTPVPPVAPTTDTYDISVRQVAQSVLPPTPNVLAGCPATFAPTNVYAYGPRNIANQPFHSWPGFTIEAKVGEGGG
jgi:hypothetical protein